MISVLVRAVSFVTIIVMGYALRRIGFFKDGESFRERQVVK